ncbi:MAG: hypothetical protein Q7T93_16795 [Methylobacterium sp.]|uniref:hypothetical protein n=1 Tax=Methylobacterium sp. TaxID=409 RepID=UPI00272802BD|nr:hypothetical protein [Methylobacterium sp.]MDO9428477.1 hypothetical protein [Methylobacterium sp.]
MSEKKAPPSEATTAPTAPNPQDALSVPMDQVITKTSKIEGSHTQETIDPAEQLPEDPKEQNDLA